MNEETSKLIQQLAEKLGTTAEHLWAVLVRQAPISAAVGLLCDAALLWLVYFGWKKFSAFMAKDDDWDSGVERGFVCGGLVIATAIIVVCVFGALSTEVSGLLNPEYWALKQILK